MNIENLIGQITYHILDIPTSFLFNLHDTDQLKAYFNNLENIIIQTDNKTIPIIWKWRHPFFNTDCMEADVYLIEPQLRHLHRRFGYPYTECLYKLLKNTDHEDI